MELDKLQSFLKNHDYHELTLGKSGAGIYSIDDQYILKYIRNSIDDKRAFELCQKESQFYQAVTCKELSCVPEIMLNESSEDEIMILMRKYSQAPREGMDDSFLYRVMLALAEIHCFEVPDFILSQRTAPSQLSADQITYSVESWKQVLDEHPGQFDCTILDELSVHINDLIVWHDAAPKSLCHGDFHMDNVLCDTKRRIIVCDWQNVGCGDASADLSFFISRLESDGVIIEKEQLVALYAKAMSDVFGTKIDCEQVLRHMYAANVITSFIFWHEYLHHTDAERVKRIFDEMRHDISGLKLWK